jgi:hypothetical protein
MPSSVHSRASISIATTKKTDKKAKNINYAITSTD